MSEYVPIGASDPPVCSAIGFDGFVLEPGRGRLLGRDGAEISLRPKAFELLVALTESVGRPLGKAKLLDRVWGKVHVSEDSLFQAVKDARRALDDREGRLLRYVPRRGYLLDCTLNTENPGDVAPEPPLSVDRPSVGVLPFRTLGEETSNYLSTGLTEEISIALSRFRWLFVLANASAVAIAGQNGDLDAESLEAARKLSIRYLVGGSFARTEREIVVRCRLVETATGRQVWQERFIRNSADVLPLYEAITSAIAAAIEPRLLRAEVERVLRRGTSNLDAFDSYLRALPGYYSRTPPGNREAIEFLEAAIARDPHFALATALLARCVATSVWLGAVPDFAAGHARVLALARAALNIDRSDPQVLALCGHLLVIVGGEHAEGGALVDLSLRMNPNNAEAWRLGGWVSAWGGQMELALHRLAEAENSTRSRLSSPTCIPRGASRCSWDDNSSRRWTPHGAQLQLRPRQRRPEDFSSLRYGTRGRRKRQSWNARPYWRCNLTHRFVADDGFKCCGTLGWQIW